MSIVLIVGVVIALAVVIAARSNRPRITQIDRTIEHKGSDDA